MIVSFRDKDAERLNAGKRVKEFQAIERIVLRKLRQLQIAGSIDDLRVPPGNRLEALKGDREGQYSIRVNDRYRICFVWSDAGPCEVEIVDYHK
ncbi:MAG: type II toxin-antitoxin system RelE/ParE family toxin [Coriobacteriales bacterium]|nr:type II toxin-antitoxin system RelE/ParE family toxin [Coriobacteriales bacterium]